MPTAIDKSLGLISGSKRIDVEKSAASVAALLAGDKSLNAAFNSAIEHMNENKKSVNSIHFSLLNLMEADPDTLECEAMDAWPVPGSKKKDVGDNEPFDRYEYKNTEGNTVKASFYGNVAKDHPIGAAILKRKEDVNNDAGLSDGDKRRKKSDIDAEFTAFQGKLRMAVAAYFHIKAMRKAFPKVVNVGYAMTGKDVDNMKIDLSSPNIIRITSRVKDGVARYFTIPNFLRLDIEKATAAGGSYEDIITSNKRAQDDENPDEEKHVTIKTNRDFEDATIATLNYLNFKFKDTVNTKDILAFYKGAGSDARLRTLFDLAEVLTKITGIKELRDRYDADVIGVKDAA